MWKHEFWLVLKLLPTNYSFTNHIYLIHMNKQDLALDNLQELKCHKKKQPTHNTHRHRDTLCIDGFILSLRVFELLSSSLLKGSVQGSLWALKFYMKHLKKAERRIGRNVIMIIKMKTIVRILLSDKNYQVSSQKFWQKMNSLSIIFSENTHTHTHTHTLHTQTLNHVLALSVGLWMC